MRPIVRPHYTGAPVTNDYKKYLKPLLDAFGPYCSYCERPDKLDVEHVQPSSKQPHLKLDWNNLLLGCPRCNRDYKKSWNDSRDDHVWPDTHNTFSLLTFYPDGRVKPSEGLAPELRQDVANTIRLVRLDDSREKQKTLNMGRRRTFKLANRAKSNYQAGFETLEEVLDQARAGYWSVWYTVFQDIEDVSNALLNDPEYPNTKNLAV